MAQALGFRYRRAVEREIKAGSYSDFQHTSFRRTGHPLPVGHKALAAHGEMTQPRQDKVRVKAHALPPQRKNKYLMSAAIARSNTAMMSRLPRPLVHIIPVPIIGCQSCIIIFSFQAPYVS